MSLRARILVGYGCLVGLLLLVAGSAALGFLNLSRGIDRVLTENVASMTAAMHMLDAFERLDRETLAQLVGDEAIDDRELRQAATDFDTAMTEATSNITVDSEVGILADLRAAYGELSIRQQELLAEHPERPLRSFQEHLGPARARVKSALRRLLRVNQEAIIEADQRARRSAVRSGTWLGFLVMLALLSFGFLSRALSTHLLARLAALRSGVQAIASGDHRRRLKEDGGDELSVIAAQLNEMVDRHEGRESQLRRRFTAQRRIVLAALAALDRPAALFDEHGELLASTLGEGHPLLDDAGHYLASVGETTEPAGFRCTPLEAGGETLGWLVEPIPETAP